MRQTDRNQYLILASLIILFINISHAQVREYEVPSITPPSPTAAAFARYDDIPVDPSTGIPRIEIPLYTIKSRQLEIPLTLSYHASGIKLNDMSTPVGLGWVISGMTGLVSRTVLDRPDEDFIQFGYNWGGRAMYPSEESYQAELINAAQTLASSINFGGKLFTDMKYRDKQADRYNYQLPGSGSGTFRYDFNTGALVKMPYKPVRIEQASLVNFEIPSFTVTDENGTKYTFDKPYKSTQLTGMCGYCYNGTANTSWYLTRIESADGTDVIEYEYWNFVNSYTTGNFSDTYVWGIFDPEYGANYSSKINPWLYENYRSNQFTTTYEPVLRRIVSSKSIVAFTYSNDRQDVEGANYRLAGIEVTDVITGRIVKSVTFDNNHYFGSKVFINGDEYWGGQRLRLNGVTIDDVRGGNTYTFGYIEGNLPPYNTVQRLLSQGTPNQQVLTFAEDFWGYYNGEYQNKGLIPMEFINAPPYSGLPLYWGNRRPNPAFAQVWTLNEVNYPTGGKSKFFYEGNSNASHAVGGLRIKKIVNTDNETFTSTAKSYHYSNGYSPRILSNELFSYSQYYNWDFMGCADPDNDGSGAYSPFGTPFFHPEAAPQRVTTNSSSFCSLSLSSGAPVLYSGVIESIINGETNEDIGRIEYTFQPPDYYIPETYDRTTGAYWDDVGSYTLPLLSRKVLKKSLGGTYVPVQETLNTYTEYFNVKYHMGVEIFQTTFDINNDSGTHSEAGFLIGQSCSSMIHPAAAQYLLFIHVLRLNNHTASTKIPLVTQTIEKQYSDNGTVATVTDIEYNLNNLQPSLKRVTGSDNVALTTDYKYPVDFPADPVYTEMVSRNIITPVIETKTYQGSTFLHSKKTNYFRGWAGNNDLILPQTVESKSGTDPVEVRVRFHEYDNTGNVLRVSKENDAQQSFIWGYGQSLPIANVINAEAKDIFHTSFEEGIFNVSEPAKTGIKNSGGPFTKTLNTLSNGNYELSYWKYQGSPAQWVNYTEPVTVANSTTGSNGTYTISLSGAPIDEVRFYPKHAQMTTFTYQPLIGVTSSTDPGGRSTYYEYDHGGRLSVIRDSDDNMIRKTGYSYRGSPENLIEGGYYNTIKYGHFTRNNCSTGYTGTQYSYEVPAFKHHSFVSQEAADQLAQTDVSTNGQTQANLHGTCIPAFTNAEQSGIFDKNCPSGFTGIPVAYTVYAGKYRAPTQAEADQLAAQDVAANGQAFADQYGICYNSSLPFITLTYENPTTQTVSYGSGGQFENLYQDVVIRFYQDRYRTIPLSVSNVEVTLIRNWYLGSQYGTDYPTFTVSGSSAVLYNDFLFWGYDTNGSFHEESFSVQAGADYNTH